MAVPSSGGPFDPASVLSWIGAETGRLLLTATTLDDVTARQPSLLPGWSRGHVLTHLARNADGGRLLLSWARTGIEAPEYTDLQTRADEIEAGSSRSAADLVTDVRRSSERFADEYARMPAEAWDRTVRWATGRRRAARRIADSRLTEVLVHHVDLDAGYVPDQWPRAFVDRMLDTVTSSFGGRPHPPRLRLRATDTGRRYDVRSSEQTPLVVGSAASLLAWLMGRSSGADLATDGGAGLPRVPFLY